MTPPRKNRGKDAPGAVQVVRRAPEERKRLPPDLEAFARSEETKLRTNRPRTPKLKDPRAVALMPGVANRDARALADARLDVLAGLLDRRREGEDVREELEIGLAEAILLGLWRGRSLTGFDAMVENILGLPLEEAEVLARKGAERLGLPLALRSESLIAVWVRSECALLEFGLPGRVGLRVDADRHEHLILDLPIRRAPEAIQEIGRRMSPLVHDKRSR